MRSKTFSAATTETLDAAVNTFVGSTKTIIFTSGFFISGGNLYLHIIYTEN